MQRRRFAEYLSHKSNFVKFGVAILGVPFGVGEFWMFGKLGGPGWWLLIAVVALIAGWVWAQLMWLAVGHDFRKYRPKSMERKEPTDN